jgi:hypothetical protein
MFLIFSPYKPVDLIHEVVFEAVSCDPSKEYVIFGFFYIFFQRDLKLKIKISQNVEKMLRKLSSGTSQVCFNI